LRLSVIGRWLWRIMAKYTKQELARASKLAERNRVPLSGLQIQAYRALENATFTPNKKRLEENK